MAHPHPQVLRQKQLRDARKHAHKHADDRHLTNRRMGSYGQGFESP